MDENSPNTFNDGTGPRRRGRDFKQGPPPLSGQDMFGKQAPRNLEAEMSLLGSMILDPNVITDVMALVAGPKDFYQESHQHIYAAVIEVYDRTNTFDLVQLQNALRDKGVEELCGGADYLVQLAECVPSAVNAPHYAKIVAEKAKLRKLIDAAGEIAHKAYNAGDLGPEGAREVLDEAEMKVFSIAEQANTADAASLSELLESEMRRIESVEFGGAGLNGVKTHFDDLDKLLQGLQPSEMLILAARPSMGKTAFVLNLAEQIALSGAPYSPTRGSKGTPVAIFSLEMSKEALTQRLLSQASGISSQFIRSAQISNRDMAKLLTASEDLKSAQIYIDDTPQLTVLTLRARARRLCMQYGVKCILIDYLQLMTSPSAARDGRQNEVSAISRGIKALARELNVPIVCLSQLNRASENREGNRPRMSDLRESGSIEQDADVIMLLHREEYYHLQDPSWAAENPDKVGLAELIVAKQRNGPTGVVKFVWDNNITRFKPHDPNAHAPDGFSGGADFVGGGMSGGRSGGGDFNPNYSSPSQAAGSSPFDSAPRSSGGSNWINPAAAQQPAAPASDFTDAFADPFAADSSGSASEPAPFEIKPTRPAGSAFGSRPKSGPAANHRDGGGSDQRPETGSQPSDPLDEGLSDEFGSNLGTGEEPPF